MRKETNVRKAWISLLFLLPLVLSAPDVANSATQRNAARRCTPAAWFNNLNIQPGNIAKDSVVSGALWVRTDSSSFTTNMAGIVQVHYDTDNIQSWNAHLDLGTLQVCVDTPTNLIFYETAHFSVGDQFTITAILKKNGQNPYASTAYGPYTVCNPPC
jgi:hypothetical protein